ncbi:hypothetical protein [Dyella tabacisoli]|uniref:Toxin co-regulated pilus biosynthesis protein Q C-terminal domain-containing protein n=1 Tax=Dyella tabacisoli TaxID=2282381 RepID=A0A369UMB1_9GAMM|nr:hypothetical protein [Dyella tabacisoli]RDD80730.1 hypothetical protein DVJ77_15985 [Dyella tabacisoli]
MRSRFGGLVAAVMLFVAFVAPAVAQDSPLYNHKAPAAYPAWFVPASELGVTKWLDSQEEPGFNTTRLVNFNYIAQTKLTPDALIKLVESYAHAHGYQVIDVDHESQKIILSEVDLEKDPINGSKLMMKLNHNYLVSLQAGEDFFTLTLAENAK